MKKLFIALVFIILALGLYAQTGLYGISFGQSMDAAIANLQSKGFKVILKETSLVDLTNTGIKDLKRVRLFFYEKKLGSWYVFYDTQNKADIKARIVKDIETLHGKGQIWDEYENEWGWQLANGNAVYLKEDREDKEVIVEYGYWKEYFGTDEEEWW